jgi:hypothetical protein
MGGAKRFGAGAVGVAMTGFMAFQNIRENGIVGGTIQTGADAVISAVSFQVAGRVFKGGWTSTKAAWAASRAGHYRKATGIMAGQGGRIVGRMVANPIAYPAVAWMGAFGEVQADAMKSLDRHHRSLGLGNIGSLAAFQTQGAWTSRQMSVQAIQRSHLNARSALGSEAQYMHRRGY